MRKTNKICYATYMRCFWQSISWPAQMIKLHIALTSTATFVCQYHRLIYEAVCAKRGRNFLQTPDFRRIFCNFARHCITE